MSIVHHFGRSRGVSGGPPGASAGPPGGQKWPKSQKGAKKSGQVMTPLFGVEKNPLIDEYDTMGIFRPGAKFPPNYTFLK